jgi:predicted nucleic acid-binding protein
VPSPPKLRLVETAAQPLRFFDTNILLYLFSEDSAKADKAEAQIAEGGLISVQVLNEFTHVARRKMGWPIGQIRDTLSALRRLLRVVDLNTESHDLGLDLAEKHQLPTYDAMILACAILGKATILVSEDFNSGAKLEGVRISNPFKQKTAA